MPQEEQFHRIFSQVPEILMHDGVLNLDKSNWSIVASKKALGTGRVLDLLLKGKVGPSYEYRLIELKDVPITQQEVDQVYDYCSTLAETGEVPHSERVEPMILTTGITVGSPDLGCSKLSARLSTCPRLLSKQPTCAMCVDVRRFDPGLVLRLYRDTWIADNKYFRMKPKQVIFYLEDFGLTHKVYRLYLNKILQYLNVCDELPLTVEDLYKRLIAKGEMRQVFYGRTKPSIMTLRNYLAQCIVFGLVRIERLSAGWTIVALTDRGKEYVKAGGVAEEINNEQAGILVDEVLLENPFAHGSILGICLFVESVFELSKNKIPVPHDYLYQYFMKKGGTERDWASERGRQEIPMHYGNMSEQLGLVRRQSNRGERMWYITPLGIDTVIRFQLAKAVRMLY